MKHILALVLILPAMALGQGTKITGTGGAPIPTAFSATDTKSQVQECKGNVVEILNLTAAEIGFGFGTSSSVPAYDYSFVPPGPNSGGRYKPKGGLSSGTYVYIRSASGSALTSLSVLVSCYNEEKP